MDEIDEPNVFVHADTYHMNIEETDFRSPILLCSDRLGYVHIGESNRGYLGAGTIDFKMLLAKGRAMGLKHWFIEHDQPADPLASIRASAAAMRQY